MIGYPIFMLLYLYSILQLLIQGWAQLVSMGDQKHHFCWVCYLYPPALKGKTNIVQNSALGLCLPADSEVEDIGKVVYAASSHTPSQGILQVFDGLTFIWNAGLAEGFEALQNFSWWQVMCISS